MARKAKSKAPDRPPQTFEQSLWAAANKMRRHMDASEYKHVCLGLIFRKYISDAFDEEREWTDLQPDPEADFILANPPFKTSQWDGENLRQDMRCSANYAGAHDFASYLATFYV